MNINKMQLWENTPGHCEEIPMITEYIPDKKKSDCAVVILPGGGYSCRANHEGEGYASFFANNGICAFVCDYRVDPHRFPLPLLDARRAVRMVRANAEKYGINKNKIAIMGSSAGGHLAALTSTYFEPIEFENADDIDKEDFIPNAQILCYPVITLLGKGITHMDSGTKLLAERHASMGEELSPNLIVTEKTPQAFIWHTADDVVVNVINSLEYTKALKKKNIPVECHIFPNGPHGFGLADADGRLCEIIDEMTPELAKKANHVSRWSQLLLRWLEYINF